jgi:hypothetical protein
MKKLIILLILLITATSYSRGLDIGMKGARQEQLTRESTLIEISADDITPASGNLVNISDPNKLIYTEDFSNAAWVKTSVTVTADAVKGPNGTLADLLTPGAADSYVEQDAANVAALERHVCQFDLRTTSGYSTIDISIYDNGHANRRAYKTIVVGPTWATYRVTGEVYAADAAFECTIGGNSSWSTGEDIYAVRARTAKILPQNPGAYHAVGATSESTLETLVNGGTLAMSDSVLQMKTGNRYETIVFRSPMYYSLAHNDSMNIFDTDHTITMVLKNDQLSLATSIVSYGTLGTSGINIVQDAVGSIQACYSKTPLPDVCVADGVHSTHESIYQIVRESNLVTIYVDGMIGMATDVTNMGTDPATNFYIGQNGGGVNFWEGSFTYLRIDKEALNLEELNKDRMKLQGLDTGYPAAPLTVDRNSYAYCDYKFGNIDSVEEDVPRICGEGGGLLTEGERTNYAPRSDSMASWSATAGIAVTSDYDTFITGESTADRVIADSQTDYIYQDTVSGIVNGDNFTFSVYAKCCDISHELAFAWADGLPANRSGTSGWADGLPDKYNEDYSPWTYPCAIRLGVDETGTANTVNTTYTTVSTSGYQRFDANIVGVGGGTGDVRVRLYAGNGATYPNGLCLGGAMLERGTFASTLINTGATSAVRLSDTIYQSLTIASINRKVLPDSICSTCNAKRLTLEFDAKCVFDSSADIGSSRYLMALAPPAGVNNLFYVSIDSSGRVVFAFYDSTGTLHQARSAANPVVFSNWNRYKVYMDTVDLASLSLLVNGSVPAGIAYTANSGIATLNLAGAFLNFGKLYQVATDASFCKIRNLKLQPEAF